MSFTLAMLILKSIKRNGKTVNVVLGQNEYSPEEISSKILISAKNV